MKRVNDEYYKVILYTIIGLILVISFYIIIINIHHYKALSYNVTVTDADIDYKNYKKNIIDIEDSLKKYRNNDLSNTLAILKNGGVFRLIPNSKLTYRDLYELNNYFINDIINNCWVQKLKELNKSEENSKIMEMLINNSKYLNNHFLDNGLSLYDSFNESKIQDDYYLILQNYLAFSNIVLSMSKR